MGNLCVSPKPKPGDGQGQIPRKITVNRNKNELSDDTIVGGLAWSELKHYIMKPDCNMSKVNVRKICVKLCVIL